MKTKSDNFWAILTLFACLLFTPASSLAQTKPAKTAQTPQVQQSAATLIQPAAPTDLEIKERTIQDLLFFPYGCLPNTIANAEEAQNMLIETFGAYEPVNNIYYGLHRNGSFDYTYRGVPIGLSYIDWFDDRSWYEFYFDSKSEATQFYTDLTNDIKQAGIPITPDRIYGGLSNRKRPISIFKHVYVFTPQLIKKADPSNIRLENVVGKYVVEFGVYKRKLKR